MIMNTTDQDKAVPGTFDNIITTNQDKAVPGTFDYDNYRSR